MESLAVSGRHRVGVGGAGGHEFAVHLGGEVLQAVGDLAGAAEAGQAVERAGGADEVADLFADVGRLFEPGPGGGKVGRGRSRPGLGLENCGPEGFKYRRTAVVERSQRLDRLLRLTGYGQRMSSDHVRPLGKDRAPKLLVEGVGLAGPAERAHRAALLEVKDGEPVG
jgi:hypothetical protein